MLGLVYMILFSVIFLSLFVLGLYTMGKITDKITEYVDKRKDSKEEKEKE